MIGKRLFATVLAQDVTEAYDIVETLIQRADDAEILTHLEAARNSLFQARMAADALADGDDA